MNKKLIFLTCLFSLLIIPTYDVVFADHGGGGGGGSCSGDCSPPTMGQDNSGTLYVNEGFSINGKEFEVSNFQQEIPTVLVQTGDPITIKLKIFENTGAQYLSHVGLLLGLEENIVNGIKVPSHPVQIIWEQSIDGIISIDLKDPKGLVSNVDVENELVQDAFGTKERLNQIHFKFTPSQPFDTDTILVEMWDYERNSWKNYFYNSLKIESPKSLDGNLSKNNETKIMVPDWFKINAQFWSKNQIDDETFSNGIKFLIKEKIINIPNLKEFEPKPQLHFIEAEKGPQHYVDRYYNDEFYKEWFDSNYPDYTIEEAVGYVSDLEIPEWVKINADLWTNDKITDKEFIAGIEFLIENGIILL